MAAPNESYNKCLVLGLNIILLFVHSKSYSKVNQVKQGSLSSNYT